MPVDLGAYFAQFIENISLGEPQVSRMARASETISAFLRTSYGLGSADVFLQGSVPNGTAVEPVDGGEYDVDIVSVCCDRVISSNDALNDLAKRFREDGRFRDRVIPKKPCVRLQYAEDEVGGFHVDVVPARRTTKQTPPLEAPRRDEGWHETAPREYTEWCRARGLRYARTVKAAKRWRDEQQSVRQAIKSIVLQVLIASCMPDDVEADADRLAETFRRLYVRLSPLSAPPVVSNPVLPSENLAARWTEESFRDFVNELQEAVEWANKATSASDVVEAADAWRELLGDDFPIPGKNQLGIRLSDASHARSAGSMGWNRELDSRYHATVSAYVQRGKRGQNRRLYPSDGPPVFAGHKLHFKAQVVAPKHVDVWWQVVNTGGHARERSGLRGEIFRGRDLRRRPTRDPSENWESTEYTGTHLIRALLVRANTVVAESSWFTVNIYARGHRFYP